MSTLNLNPAKVNVNIPVDNTFSETFIFEEEISGDFSASLYSKKGDLIQEFDVTQVSQTSEETTILVTLPDTSEKIRGRWELVSVNGRYKTQLGGNFNIQDADPTDRPSNNQVIGVSASGGSVQVRYLGTPGPAGRELETRVENGVLQQRYVGALSWTDVFDLGDYLSVDRFPPYISDKTLSTTEDIDELTIDFVKAEDTATPQSGLVYEYYEGDPALLNDLDTIESQTLRDTGTDVSQFIVSAQEGEQVSGNVLVKDEAGNKAIYDAFTVLIPEQTIDELTINEDDFTLDEEGQESFEFSIDIIASEGADESVTVTSSDTDVVTITVLTDTTFRADLVTPLAEQTAVNIEVVSDFDSSKRDTITATCIPHTIEAQQESETFEFTTEA